jgi:putative spermidine/putrescine transport system ATP-binding protein
MQASSRRSLPIEIEALSKAYGKVRALDCVDLEIRAGEFLTLLGPSGSGKTTLLMALAGFIVPDAGRIRFGETEVTLTPPHRRNVGMVFQNYALFPHMTVIENVAYPLRVRGVARGKAHAKAERVLDMMRLGGFGSRRTTQLSGGQQQRVALARAVVFEPPILLMDEPLSALDKKLREAMQAEIRGLHEQIGTTTVYVTHDQREALALSDRVAVFHDGRIRQIGASEAVYRNPANLFVADFIGDSHFMPLSAEGGRLMLGRNPLRLAAPPPAGERLFLLLRPEKLEVLAAAPADTDNVIEGVVTRRTFLGDTVQLTVRLEGGTEISVKLLSRHGALSGGLRPGAPIRLALHQEDTVVVPAQAGEIAPAGGGEG